MSDFVSLPLLDHARLDKLKSLIPPPALQTIVQSYLDTDFCAGLDEVAPSADPVLPDMAHDCKGTSANMGAARLRGIAEALEAACHTGNHDAIARLLPELQRVTVLTRTALAAWLATV